MFRLTNTTTDSQITINGITRDNSAIVLGAGESVNVEPSSLVPNFRETLKIFESVKFESEPKVDPAAAKAAEKKKKADEAAAAAVALKAEQDAAAVKAQEEADAAAKVKKDEEDAAALLKSQQEAAAAADATKPVVTEPK